ncbi:MAG: HAD family hydrolase [Roseburia sp.]|nr:HAD family hydrolase [Roseburia sp.]MCM1097360.1 HAD family hydrolase [Ruminococcus flavefaciens]
MKTLYVTDLDGTLMRDDKTVSAESAAILNRLLARGIPITYATARSLRSASAITKDVSFRLPVIIRNGAILADPQSGEELEIAMFGEELRYIRQALAGVDVPGFATAYFGSEEVKLCLAGRGNEGFQDYLRNHSTDRRIRMVDTEEELYEGKTCYFTFIAPREELQLLYERVRQIEGINCVFQQDKYRPEYWLELCPGNATKATAIQRVKRLCGCERVVVFGDSINDIPMFRMADEAYATGNAMDELKKMATGIIGENNEDGVARWLEARVLRR